MNIENVQISKLKPYDRNQKKHDDVQINNVAESIRKYGFVQPIVVDNNGIVIIGHCRLAAAKKLNIKEVPCVRMETLSEEEANKLRLLDNKLNESEWDMDLLLEDIPQLDFSEFDIDWQLPDIGLEEEPMHKNPMEAAEHNVFENQDTMQFPCNGYYGIPEMKATQTVGDKFLRFRDWNDIENPQEYIAHFYYDDYKFIAAWREPNKYLEKLKQFKAVVSPDFSLYTDFPRALQILSCYRRQWCGAYWQHHGIDVIPDVVWGDKESYNFCFDGIPKKSTVCVSTLGVANDDNWNDKNGNLFRDGYNEMMNRLEPTTILFYGSMIEGLEGNIIKIPSYYEEKFKKEKK